MVIRCIDTNWNLAYRNNPNLAVLFIVYAFIYAVIYVLVLFIIGGCFQNFSEVQVLENSILDLRCWTAVC